MISITNQLDPLSQVRSARSAGALPVFPVEGAAGAKVQTEFMAIFYKELLKEVFTTPKFTVEEQESGFNSAISSMNADLMAEKMAEYLVKNAQLSKQWSGSAGEGPAR